VKALREGQYIRHELFGFGFISETDADRTTIHFDTCGTKKFVTNLMAVDVIADTHPNPPRTRRGGRKKPVDALAAKTT
jgi:hypothetical protein